MLKRKHSAGVARRGGGSPPIPQDRAQRGGRRPPSPWGRALRGGRRPPHPLGQGTAPEMCEGGLEPPPPSHRGGYSAGARGRANSAGAREKSKIERRSARKGGGGGWRPPKSPGEGDARPLWVGLRGYFALTGWGGPGARLRRRIRVSFQKVHASRASLGMFPPRPPICRGSLGGVGGVGRDSFGFRLEL